MVRKLWAKIFYHTSEEYTQNPACGGLPPYVKWLMSAFSFMWMNLFLVCVAFLSGGAGGGAFLGADVFWGAG